MKVTTLLFLSLLTSHGHKLTYDEHSKRPEWDDLRDDYDKPSFHRSGYHFGPSPTSPSSSRITRITQ